MTLKLASSVLWVLNHGRLKLALESCAHMANFQRTSITMQQSQKGKEVDCVEPFNSAVAYYSVTQAHCFYRG